MHQVLSRPITDMNTRDSSGLTEGDTARLWKRFSFVNAAGMIDPEI